MNLPSGPAADGVAAVEQHLQQTDDPRLVDFDAGIAHCPDRDGQGQPLQEWEVHVHVEAVALEIGKMVGDGLETLAHGVEVIEPFLEAEVAQVVGAKLVAEEAGKLLILLEESIFQ